MTANGRASARGAGMVLHLIQPAPRCRLAPHPVTSSSNSPNRRFTMSNRFLLSTVAAACALTLPAMAQSRQFTLSTTLKSYGGNGACVGARRTLKVTAELADALLDAGYEIRIDAAAEDMRDSPAEIRVPLSRANAGKPQPGEQYIQAFSFA